MKRRRRGGSRRRRARVVPKWLLKGELDQVARERCLLILSVLSGEKPVTSAIEEARISRGRYYQLETRALSAMLRSLEPASAPEPQEEASPKKRIRVLEAKVKDLEQARRRAERLLLMTRRVMKGKERKTPWIRNGSGPSPSSRKRTAQPSPPLRTEETGAGGP
jgi:hypothetical protein